jgi:hypothetical protein
MVAARLNEKAQEASQELPEVLDSPAEQLVSSWENLVLRSSVCLSVIIQHQVCLLLC